MDGFESLKDRSLLAGEAVPECDLGLASLTEEEVVIKAELEHAIGERRRALTYGEVLHTFTVLGQPESKGT